MSLDHLLADLLADPALPDTRVAETAWPRARARLRRRRAAGLAGVAAVTAGVVGVVSLPHGTGRSTSGPVGPAASSPPAASTSTPIPHADVVGTRDVTPTITQDLLTPAELGRLARGAGVAANPAYPPRATPAGHAYWAVQTTPSSIELVAGDDDHQYRLDLAGGPVQLFPGSLSPAVDRLALGQGHDLLVVDLASNAVRHYAIPGGDGAAPAAVAWDGQQRLRVRDHDGGGWTVDLRSGGVTPASAVPTGFTADGPMSWGGGDITLPDGTTVSSTVANDGVPVAPAPLVVDGDVVGFTRLDDGRTGVVAVDPATGDPVAFLPVDVGQDDSVLLRHSDVGEAVLVGVPTSASRSVVRWDFANHRLDHTAFIPLDAAGDVPTVTWGGQRG